MDDSRATTAPPLGSSFKENEPPPKSRRTINLSGLFEKGERLRKENTKTARNPLAPRPAGVAKSTGAKGGFFAQFSKPKGKEHPVYTSFKETLSEYKYGAHEAREHGIQPVYEELFARVDGLDVNGRPVYVPSVPTQADIDDLAAMEEILSKPLDDDVLQVKDRKGRVRDVHLGESIREFETKSKNKRAELAQLIDQLKSVDIELVEAKKDALRAEKNEVKVLRDKLADELDRFKEAALKIKEQTEAEVKAALKEEKKATKEWEARIAALTD